MKIEVACQKTESTTEKGRLFQKLALDLLLSQNYDVIEEIRFTGSEIDLHCKHKINNRKIYVECKAHSSNISAPILRQLLGTVEFHEYDEGWLLSTSELGKDAKGFVEEWNKKPKDKSSKLSFYTPQNIIDSLQSASIISEQPSQKAQELIRPPELIGDWSLLVTPFGRFWSVYVLRGGIPHGAIFFNAKSGDVISDKETLTNIGSVDSSCSNLDIYTIQSAMKKEQQIFDTELPNVVEVQTGDSWNDYSPARPKDFIGREEPVAECIESCV